jgi:hypothetical protein
MAKRQGTEGKKGENAENGQEVGTKLQTDKKH